MPGIKLFRSFRFVSFCFVRVTGMATGWDRRGILDGVAIHRCSTHPSTRFRGSVLLPPVCSFGAGEIPLHPAPDPVDPSSGRGSRRPTVVHTCPRADHAVCVCGGRRSSAYRWWWWLSRGGLAESVRGARRFLAFIGKKPPDNRRAEPVPAPLLGCSGA
jgi:hypothetical protein